MTNKLIFSEVEAAVTAIAPDYRACSDAPDTWLALQTWYSDTYPGTYCDEMSIPVWDGASEQTIYSTPAGNYSFRAWHDTLHLLLHLPFEYEAEKQLGDIHRATLQRFGCSVGACAAIWFDTAGQTEYEAKYGEFPTDQRAFVEACLNALYNISEFSRGPHAWERRALAEVLDTGFRF